MTKKDFKYSVITGLITGLIVWWLFDFWNVPDFKGVSYFWLVLVTPIFWVCGVWLGYFLSKWFSFFKQFGKFVAIGFTNAAIDFGVFNLLIFSTGKALGIVFPIFKGISFLVAVINSYIWNKYWAFEAGESRGGSWEAAKFFIVNIIAIAVNIGVGSFVANGVDPLFGLSDKAWANLAAISGSAIAFIMSFLGFRLLVFKTKRNNSNLTTSDVVR